jgi:hypothetical protein
MLYLLDTVTCVSVTIEGNWIGIRFIEHLQTVTKSNYSAITDHTLYSSLQHALRS